MRLAENHLQILYSNSINPFMNVNIPFMSGNYIQAVYSIDENLYATRTSGYMTISIFNIEMNKNNEIVPTGYSF